MTAPIGEAAGSRREVVSLNRRLLVVAAVVLVAFLGLTGSILDNAFRQSLEQAQQDRLQGTLYTILAAADLTASGLRLPHALPDSRLSTPGSGLYARVIDEHGEIWRSPSLLGLPWEPEQRLAPGDTRFQRELAGDQPIYTLAYGLSWEDAGGKEWTLTVHVAEDLTSYQAQLSAFRRSLWGWLGAASAVLLATQLLVLRWSLLPLRRVAADLRAIEEGRAELLHGRYPAEILGLTQGLNALLSSERRRARRYQETLANLAHSLKTPLAVLRGALDRLPEAPPEALEQIARIDAAVDYQLRRAAAAAPETLAAPLPVKPVLERLLQTLRKAYPDKTLDCELRSSGEPVFYGSEGDLMELLGNLLDNAFKWGRQRLRVSITPLAAGPGGRRGLRLEVEDDGPGIRPEQAQLVLERGRRADEQVPGHGIGLAVVAELVSAFQGTIAVDRGELGGALFRIELPAA